MIACRECKHSKCEDDGWYCMKYKEPVRYKGLSYISGVTETNMDCEDAREGPCGADAKGFELSLFAKFMYWATRK